MIDPVKDLRVYQAAFPDEPYLRGTVTKVKPGKSFSVSYDREPSLDDRPEEYEFDWDTRNYFSVLAEPASPRAQLLDEACRVITTNRNTAYGEPEDNFARISGVLQALGYRAPGPEGPGTRDMLPHDTAVIGKAFKLGRISESPGKKDHWLDTSGYAACGWECVVKEGLAA